MLLKKYPPASKLSVWIRRRRRSPRVVARCQETAKLDDYDLRMLAEVVAPVTGARENGWNY